MALVFGVPGLGPIDHSASSAVKMTLAGYVYWAMCIRNFLTFGVPHWLPDGIASMEFTNHWE
jgi:hypothetical protein